MISMINPLVDAPTPKFHGEHTQVVHKGGMHGIVVENEFANHGSLSALTVMVHNTMLSL